MADIQPVIIETPQQAAALLDRIAETLPGIDAVRDFIVDHEDELGGGGAETLILTLETDAFARQLVKARAELLHHSECSKWGH